MAQAKPESARIWPIAIACVCIILATIAAALSAVLSRSWPGFFGAIALGGCILHLVWGELVSQGVGQSEKGVGQ